MLCSVLPVLHSALLQLDSTTAPTEYNIILGGRLELDHFDVVHRRRYKQYAATSKQSALLYHLDNLPFTIHIESCKFELGKAFEVHATVAH